MNVNLIGGTQRKLFIQYFISNSTTSNIYFTFLGVEVDETQELGETHDENEESKIN